MADQSAEPKLPATRREPAKSPVLARALRHLADLLDRKTGKSHFRASPREISFITFFLLFTGILFLGLAIHGRTALFYLLLFALFFNTGVFVIFHSTTWPEHRRMMLAALISIAAVDTASERLLPALLICALGCYFVLYLVKKWEFPPQWLNVLLVLLFCYTSYDLFAATLEWRRNTALTAQDQLPLSCAWQKERGLSCSASRTAFDVPEFWKEGTARYLLADLDHIIAWQLFTDSATDNRIGFAAFRSPPAAILRTLTDFFNVQQNYLKSKAIGSKALLPQGILKSRDSELYALSYRSPHLPGYLGSFAERNALLFLYQPQLSADEERQMSWLFVFDGTDLAAREFLLHRIVTGFRRLP